jgi:hypothetical protein
MEQHNPHSGGSPPEHQPPRPELNPDALSPEDEVRLAEHVQSVVQTGEPLDDTAARSMAVLLHDGEGSGLLELARTGTVRNAAELRLELAVWKHSGLPGIGTWLIAFDQYLTNRIDHGPVDGWQQLWPLPPPGTETAAPPPDNEEAVRTELMERITAAGVTTLGEVATILTVEQEPDGEPEADQPPATESSAVDDRLTPRSNKEILAAAKLGIELAAVHAREQENMPGVRALADYLVKHEGMGAPLHLMTPEMTPGHPLRREVMSGTADAAIFRLWSRSKVVYAMDDLMLGYLSESSPSQIPTEILRNLPHTDPYLLLPRPDFSDPQTNYYRTHMGIPLGVFVFGRHDEGQRLCSTASERREDFGLMFVNILDTEDGPVSSMLRCTIPLRQQMFTVEDAVNTTIGKFNFTGDLAEDDPAKLEAWLRTYVTQAFNSLLYVCTDQPDVEIYQPGSQRAGKPAKSRTRRRPRPDDIDTVVKLGFRMGPALHKAQKHWEATHDQHDDIGEPSGRVRPHQKKGHHRTYWTGQGRTVPKLKWIKPFWVNEDLLDAAGGPTDVVVRPVKKGR